LIDEVEFVFDIRGYELVAWYVTLCWFYPQGIETAIERFLKIATVGVEE